MEEGSLYEIRVSRGGDYEEYCVKSEVLMPVIMKSIV
jgi:hypothetical protein